MAWAVYRDASLTGNDTTPVGVDVSTAAGVAALLTGTTKTPIPVTGGSLYIRAASTANSVLSGYLVHRDIASSGKAFMEPFTLALDGSKDGALYVQTDGPYDVSMDAEVELVFTSGDATAFSVWTRQI